MTQLDHPNHRHGKSIALSIAFLFISSSIVLWAWNTLAVDLFAQPEMQFKHGFAFMLAIFAILSVAPITKRIYGQSQED